jgi:hypothetical protein
VAVGVEVSKRVFTGPWEDKALDKAYEDRTRSLNFLNVSPAFTTLRQDSRFIAMIGRLEFNRSRWR